MLAACASPASPQDPIVGAEQALISDGAHGGNAHFFFLSPMVPAPSPTGTFDAAVDAAVHICPWDSVEDECGPDLVIFTTRTGPGSETIRIDPEAEQYIVNWHTDDLLDVAEIFRIRVVAEGQTLGFADVQVVGSMREVKNVATDEFIPLLDGRTLPIKFRIEEGAIRDDATFALGTGHTCVIREDGTWCWGSNSKGQLGSPYVGAYSVEPVLVLGEHDFRTLSAGFWQTCAIATDGAIWCWGATGLVGLRGIPIRIDSPLVFESVGVGIYHACAVTVDGEAWCWGSNGFGELGAGGTVSSTTPVPVAGGLRFRSLAGGVNHTCGLTVEGDVYCWGRNDLGALGLGRISYRETAPTDPVAGAPYQALSVGEHAFHSCALAADGQARCWGYNRWGQVGRGTVGGSWSTPQVVVGGHSFTALAVDNGHSCGLAVSGDAYCWGWNSWGQLGNGEWCDPAVCVSPHGFVEPTPQLVLGNHTFTSLAAGGGHNCGQGTDGGLYCWGLGNYGQLGTGTLIDAQVEPVAVNVLP